MELATADIQLLYGPVLWLLEAPAPAVLADQLNPAEPANTAPTTGPGEITFDPLPPKTQEPAKSANPAQPAPTAEPATPANPWVLFPAGKVSLVLPTQPLSAGARKLLVDILAAMGLPPQQNVLKHDSAPAELLLLAPTHFVFIFDHNFQQAPMTLAGKTTVLLPTPEQMLADASLKRLAWERLKPLKDRI